MAKSAIYAEQAKELYVNKGLSLDTIVGILDKKVSRKTLYNWKMQGEWDKKREEYLKSAQSLYEGILEIAILCKDRAKLDPSPMRLLALSRALAMLTEKDALAVIEDKSSAKVPGDGKEDTVKMVRELLGVDEPQ